jgi:hypothetical protein
MIVDGCAQTSRRASQSALVSRENTVWRSSMHARSSTASRGDVPRSIGMSASVRPTYDASVGFLTWSTLSPSQRVTGTRSRAVAQATPRVGILELADPLRHRLRHHVSHPLDAREHPHQEVGLFHVERCDAEPAVARDHRRDAVQR